MKIKKKQKAALKKKTKGGVENQKKTKGGVEIEKNQKAKPIRVADPGRPESIMGQPASNKKGVKKRRRGYKKNDFMLFFIPLMLTKGLKNRTRVKKNQKNLKK